MIILLPDRNPLLRGQIYPVLLCYPEGFIIIRVHPGKHNVEFDIEVALK
jgi:hypothetical protein